MLDSEKRRTFSTGSVRANKSKVLARGFASGYASEDYTMAVEFGIQF